MFGKQERERLRLHRQALIVESDLNRLTIEAEIQKIRASTAWIRGTIQTYQQIRPFISLAAPVLGFLVVRLFRAKPKAAAKPEPEQHQRSSFGWARLLPIVFSIWRSRSKHVHT